MDRTIEILTCDMIASLPSIEQILDIPREKTLRIIFLPPILMYRESIGAEWREKLPGFSVGIHMIRPEINISKLITEEEIVAHAVFFEQCARDYRNLATDLIHGLAAYLKEAIDPENAMHTFGKYKRGRQTGKMDVWDYYLHGAHCGFKNSKTCQKIEVYLITSLEFGDLDPYFFIEFIKTTPRYQPMPVKIYEDYWDGCRILDKMVAIGKFERIQLFATNDEHIVLKDRVNV
jgi:hypothetical protein